MKSPLFLSCWKPLDAAGLVLFRKIFAVCLIIQVFEFYAWDIINKTFVINYMHIPFHFSAWLPALPGKLMHLPFLAQLLGACMLFSARHARRGALIYLISFSYVVLLDISYYNNHFYLVILLSLFYCFFNPQPISGKEHAPALLIWLFRFQIIAVYFFGGVAKLNSDWLISHEPMHQMLQNAFGGPPPAALVLFYTYAGLFFDLFIGLLLLWPKSRKTAIILNIAFHLLNLLMFESGKNATIGIFPFLMIASNLLFVDADWIRQRFSFFFPAAKQTRKTTAAPLYAPLKEKHKKIVLGLAVVYVGIQIFLPLRHFLIPGNVDWTNEGYYFAWRMKIRAKETTASIVALDEKTGSKTLIDPYRFMNTMQFKAVCEDPAAMHYFVQHLKQKAFKLGMVKPVFKVKWMCALNGRSSRPVVDSTADFGSYRLRTIGHNEWILPLN